ncbi:hypothetical protein ISN45_Aa07g031040 [Arabidopsis thaliana x Arabidopsis arenosa]|uniref:RNI-like superfamily protein n=1 Tax=Arabidopsis thaliana x Arabidopsis arenosa TaxID=1240361 RepID=A0A8T1YB06_9BRAS|nr:hypothetical protein ISN45_Aa07g031040 [Arabidopsis thaliana x Arabidopsis arenosa]
MLELTVVTGKKEGGGGASSIQCLMLNSINDTVWAMKMKIAHKVHKAWDVIETNVVDKYKNDMAIALLFQSISETLVLQIRELDTAKKVNNGVRGEIGPREIEKDENGFFEYVSQMEEFSLGVRLREQDVFAKVLTTQRPFHMWRKIDMFNPIEFGIPKYELEIMCRHVVDRSQGGLVEINISNFGTDYLLNYVADSLRGLRLAMCTQITNDGVAKAVVKLPLLEDLDVSYCGFSRESLRVVGQSCPNLKTLKLNGSPAIKFFYCEPNNIAIAIAESMHELRNLQLFRNRLNNTGLNAILDGCPHLEHLDLCRCFNIKLVGVLKKRFSERIRVLRRPYDSTADFPFEVTNYPFDCSDDDDFNEPYGWLRQ